MRTYRLKDRDGMNDTFLDVVVAGDPYTGDAVRTVFAWGHPVMKIVTEQDDPEVGYLRTTWWWIGLDLGPELTQTRHRDVVVNFLSETGMLTGDYEDALELFVGALGETELDGDVSPEEGRFNQLVEFTGEHEPDAFVDRIVHEIPGTEE